MSDWGVCVQLPAAARDFYFLYHVQTDFSTTQPPSEVSTATVF